MGVIENIANVFEWAKEKKQSNGGITSVINNNIDWSSINNYSTFTCVLRNAIQTPLTTMNGKRILKQAFYGGNDYDDIINLWNSLGLVGYISNGDLQEQIKIPFGTSYITIEKDATSSGNPYNYNGNKLYLLSNNMRSGEFADLQGGTFNANRTVFPPTTTKSNVGFISDGNVYGIFYFLNNESLHHAELLISVIELDVIAKNFLGNEYAFTDTYEDSDKYGIGGIAQGLEGIVDTVSDNVNIPLKSNKGVTGTGFVNIYEISTNQLTDFGKDMFSDIDIDFDDQISGQDVQEWVDELFTGTDIDPSTLEPSVASNIVANVGNTFLNVGNMFKLVKTGLKNYFNSKLISYVLSVHIIPVNPTTSANAERINVGFKTFTQTAKRVLDDYIDYDCGTLHIPSKYKNFLDYTHTSCKLFLPFIGFVDIGSRYVYDCDVNIKYRFSVIDGTCTAFVSSSAMNGTTSIIGTYSGTCCLHIPFTGENYSQLVSSLVQTTTSVAGAVATGNFAVGMANASRPTMASVNAPTMRIAKAKDDENPIFYTTREDMASYNRALSNARNDYSNAMQNRATTIQNAKFGRNMNTANALMGNIGNVTGALSGSAMGNGSMSSSSAFMGVRRPYIIIERPIPQLPPTYFKNHGGLANITDYPKNCKGFTQCVDVQLDCNIKTDIALKLKEIMETGFIV